MENIKNNLQILTEILAKAREAVFMFNKDGRIIYANETAGAETEYADFSNVDITVIYPMALHHGRNGVTWQGDDYMQTFAYRENKTCYPVKLSCSVITAGEDEIIVSYAINDSERYNAVRNHRKAMEEVEDANKMKNEFTANITHELRTPINGIKGMAEGLQTTELTPQQEETVGIILRCCDNMTKIINDILDFSKIEAGKIEIENAEFSLKKFLNDQLAFHSVKMNEKGLKLVVNVSGAVPEYIIGDELRLGQVLNNLFSNAIKFTSSGQVAIELTANRLEDGQIELFFMIIDTGIGISAEERDKLFRSFSQVDGSITRRFGGTGLGLAITKQLVTLMGGTIGVESEKGKGSTFSFTVKVGQGTKSQGKIDFPTGSFVFSKNLPSAGQREENLGIGDYSSPEGIGNAADIGGAENIDVSEGLSPADIFGNGEMDPIVFTESTGDIVETEIRENLEKFMICVELGSWEKAENFATVIRNLIAEQKPELKSKAFSMLLNARKEDYDATMKLLKELGEIYGI